MWGATIHDFGIAALSRFQLTHPMWGVTKIASHNRPTVKYFNSHTPCGVRPAPYSALIRHIKISTHTPHVGCDRTATRKIHRRGNFNSHTPCGVRLDGTTTVNNAKTTISTHTPHVGCDRPEKKSKIFFKISTHTPHVGCDRCRVVCYFLVFIFQLTHPMWGATPKFSV